MRQRTLAPPSFPAANTTTPPFCVTRGQQIADGFAVELLRAALAATGREATFKVAQWSELKDDLAQGRLKVLPCVSQTPERESIYDFTAPYLTMHAAIVVREGEQRIRDISDLQGLRVAVLQGDALEEYVRRIKLPADLVATPTFVDALRSLETGACAAVLIPRLLFAHLVKQYDLKGLVCLNTPIRGYTQKICFAVREGDKELLATLNEGLAIVQADGNFRQLYAKWFVPMAPVQLGGARIRVGGSGYLPPYEFLDRIGQPAGLDVDVTRAIAKRLGLQVDIQLDVWARTVARLRAGELDLVQSMAYSADRAQGIEFSLPHHRADTVLVTRQGSPAWHNLQELTNQTVLVRQGDLLEQVATQAGLEPRLIRTATMEEALRRLAHGEGDGALVDRIAALSIISEQGWHNLQVATKNIFTKEYCFAVKAGNGELLAQFNEGVAAAEKSGELRLIREKWLTPYEQPAQSTRQVVAIILWIIGPLLAILAIALAWTQTLKRQVRRKTGELKESAQRFRSIVDASPIGMHFYRLSPDGQLILTGGNQAAERVLGVQHVALLGKTLEEAFPKLVATEIPALYKRVASGELGPQAFEIPYSDERSSGLYDVRVFRTGPAAIVASFLDISDRKRLEEQLRQSEKMQAIGQLAGGVAHDFNNQLGGIMGFAEMLSEGLADPTLQGYATKIMSAATRAAELTRQLLAFSRKGKYLSVAMDVHQVITEVVELLQRSIDKRIEITQQLDATPATVLGDPSQLQNAILNLGLNARDAMPAGGVLRFATGVVSFTETLPSEELEPGRYLQISVTDTGIGMDASIMKRLFEPFFTTKDLGKGTGLGLASAYGTVKNHGGTIRVVSAPGRGSTFDVYLPIYEVQTPPESAPAAGRGVPATNRGRILMVDDEAVILEIGQAMLHKQGYDVLTSQEAQEALALYRREWRNLDVVILDMVMPRLGARELFLAMRAINPQIKAVLSSGFTIDGEAQAILDLGVLGFIQKPFRMVDLLHKVAEVLPPAVSAATKVGGR